MLEKTREKETARQGPTSDVDGSAVDAVLPIFFPFAH